MKKVLIFLLALLPLLSFAESKYFMALSATNTIVTIESKELPDYVKKVKGFGYRFNLRIEKITEHEHISKFLIIEKKNIDDDPFTTAIEYSDLKALLSALEEISTRKAITGSTVQYHFTTTDALTLRVNQNTFSLSGENGSFVFELDVFGKSLKDALAEMESF